MWFKLWLRACIALGWRPSLPPNEAIRFLVIVPTVRQGLVENTIRQLLGTFTVPTDFLLMDGATGKAQVLNECLSHTLSLQRHTFYATIDDDIVMPPGWQDTVIQAFRNIPDLGAVGLDYEATEIGDRLIHGRNPEQLEAEIPIRQVNHNLPGGNIITRSHYALAVGSIPILPQIRYSFIEDGWRSKKFIQLGLKTLFIIGQAPVQLLAYNDTADYLSFKQSELKQGRAIKENKLRWFWIRLKQVMFPLN